MVKARYAKLIEVPGESVVTAAERRIARLFNSGRGLVLSLSGGKDSLCLHDLIYRYVIAHPECACKLEVTFFDEEAVFDECIDLMHWCRQRWLAIGVKFTWYALPCKHNNCFHSLEDEETWVVYDPACRDRWVRQPPPFAITDSPIFSRPGQWNYQQASALLSKGRLRVCGVRMDESYQRRNSIKSKLRSNNGELSLRPADLQYPMWDWRESDVWLYIREHGLPYPRAYENIYAVLGAGRLRMSQFFSIDTAGALARMAEYYPGLWDRIVRREPNAYLASLYFESEMFRRVSKRKRVDASDMVTEVDYKSRCYTMLRDNTYVKRIPIRSVLNLITCYRQYMVQDDWAKLYAILTAGDPKGRSIRALSLNVRGRRVYE